LDLYVEKSAFWSFFEGFFPSLADNLSVEKMFGSVEIFSAFVI